MQASFLRYDETNVCACLGRHGCFSTHRDFPSENLDAVLSVGEKMALTFDRDQKDTIAAIATGTSEAGIGIIRVSGPDAERILHCLYRTRSGMSKKEWKPNTIHYGVIIDPLQEEEVIDEVLVSWMKAPHSYTTEDTAEINTHGGRFILNRVLDAVLCCGARLAEPGEFTKRAFLGGRMDLSEAGAVMDLIHAQNEFARKVSLHQLQGSVSGKIKELRGRILYEIAFIESALDDPENYSLEGYPSRLSNICMDIHRELCGFLRRSEQGSVLKDGIRTVIIGKPNAGKSSLMNAMAGEERAIVTSIAGTTRDTLCETIRLGDILLHVTDTAGIRETEDEVEKIGVERAKKALEDSQLILFVLDSSADISKEDLEIASFVQKEIDAGKCGIVIKNKSDLPSSIGEEETKSLLQGERVRVMETSLLHSNSADYDSVLERLRLTIEELFQFDTVLNSNEPFVSAAFQKNSIREAIHSLELVQESIEIGMSEDFFSIDLRNAYSSLGKVIGEEVEDDLVEEIFSRFCLGK